eukprot:GEMP01001903.1.p1 GENE.GEMP01001903.1~~GEMP01001903.1.p1  ORF type:complete len:1281 (+),score=223.00 GEMP01001903.1:215-4057(+)
MASSFHTANGNTMKRKARLKSMGGLGSPANARIHAKSMSRSMSSPAQIYNFEFSTEPEVSEVVEPSEFSSEEEPVVKSSRGATPNRSSVEKRPSPKKNREPLLLFIDVLKYCRDMVECLLRNNWTERRPHDPIFRLFQEVSSDPGAQRWKCILVVGALIKTVILHLSSDLIFKLTRDLYGHKDLSGLLRRGLLLTLCGATHTSLTKYAQARLQILYRTKLTAVFHSEYFKKQRYYHISQTLPPSLAITDPEERLSREVGSMAGRLANFTQHIISAFPTIIWFTLRLYWEAGPLLAVLPHLYLFAAYEVSQRVFPKNIAILHRKNAKALSEYRQSASRVQRHSEVIAALQGEQREDDILKDKLKSVVNGELDVVTAHFKFDLTFKLAYTYGFRPWISFALMFYLMRQRKKQVAGKLADLRLMYQLMLEMLIGNGTLLTMHATHRHIQGLAARLVDFIDRLKTLTPYCANVKESDCIKFENVDVVTPTGNLLVKDLSFKVKDGDALLLTGHNGAGKSSIFRCLGGLWPVTGAISKPHSLDIFYLPQKPYNVYGTLKAQVTYPKMPEELPDSILKVLLEEVGLEHLLEHNVSGIVQAWEHQLSLGEQQRLAICRLFFHKPKFAVLDECTSAVPTDVEEQLYENLQRYKIAYITICHRPALKRFHQVNLHLTGDGYGGWTLTEIPASDRTYAKKSEIRKCRASITGLGEDPDPPPATIRKRSALSRVVMLFRLMAPNAGKQLVVLCVLIALRTIMRESGSRLLARMVKGLVNNDVRMLATTSLLNFGSSIISAVNEDFRVLYEKRFVTQWYEQLSTHWRQKWLGKRKFYAMQQTDKRISDADQRGVNEIKELCDQVASLFGSVVTPMADLAWFGWQLHSYIGPGGVLLLCAYNVSCGVFLRACMPDYKSLVRKEQELESAYRFQHTRLRDHAESIAFFRGDEMEQSRCDSNFDALRSHLVYRQKKESTFKWCVSLVSRDGTGSSNSHFFGVPDFVSITLQKLQLGHGGSDWAQSNWYTESAIRNSIDACANLFGASGDVLRLFATSSRLAYMLDVLDCEDNAQTSTVGLGDRLIFENVQIKTPGNGLILAQGLSFDCQSLLVTGPNGSGKTSLFRVLSGLWPVSCGQVSRPDPLFLAPQTPYMIQGTLRDQVSYPIKIAHTKNLDVELRTALILVDLEFLIEREGWDTHKRWEEVLSLGEQQRICLARVFFHHPIQVVLDECTSAIAADSELRLYERLSKDKIKLITLSQRLAIPLRKFHDVQVSFGEPGATGCIVEDFRKNKN